MAFRPINADNIGRNAEYRLFRPVLYRPIVGKTGISADNIGRHRKSVEHYRVDNLRVIGPEELRRMWKSNSDDERRQKLNFDAVVSFSSIEHSGLGRYGDALNPWGDLIASAQAW